MRVLTAIGAGRGRRWTFVLTLLAAAIVFGSVVGSASATDGSFVKKLSKGIDLCRSQGGRLDMDGPNTLICGFTDPVSADDLADADRFCHSQLHGGELFLNTGEVFPFSWGCPFRPPKSGFP